MVEVSLPNNGWHCRPYQDPLWDYLDNGGKRALQIAHRRWGKDDVCLHWTAISAMLRVGNYWHLLPEAAQARKAVWEAVNPHTGKRRIDEAFPKELRVTTRENEMLIKFLNGSTWQVLGSDNFNSLVGSPPLGVVFSEYALANPASWAYIRPILRENDGWAVFITTPRGKNHLWEMYSSVKNNPKWYCSLQTVEDTGALTPQQIAEERHEYITQYGDGVGEGIFEQEYYCSFDASIIGAIFATEMINMKLEKRMGDVPFNPNAQVFTAWDLGSSDATVIIFYQFNGNRINIIDCYAGNLKDINHYLDYVDTRPYRYAKHYFPHDARHKTILSNRSVIEQAVDRFGHSNCAICPDHKLRDGLQAARAFLNRCAIDENNTGLLIEALRQYHRKYDEDLRSFSDKPAHDWCSHYCDAVRYAAVSWQIPQEKEEPVYSLKRKLLEDSYDYD